MTLLIFTPRLKRRSVSTLHAHSTTKSLYSIHYLCRQKTTIHSVGMYTDFKADESYTPNRLSILIGNDFNDLHEIEVSSFS